jgi:DNA replication licensing factor MCM5
MPDKSDFMDQQRLKLQEAPELIPTGEMPRSLVLIVDRELTDKVTPGNRVKVVAILGIHSREAGGGNERVNSSYLRVIGLQSEQNRDVNSQVAGFAMPNITQDDEEQIVKMSKDPSLYKKLTSSIASAIYGHDDIKKAICCLLFGGSPKRLPDGMRLRGDINVLLLGDPSVAKSQFLKFVERVAPISVYTSGKGSSAAGLTAAVIKDAATGDFQLEGGAMVLADGGVVCIDEFDKMRP